MKEVIYFEDIKVGDLVYFGDESIKHIIRKINIFRSDVILIWSQNLENNTFTMCGRSSFRTESEQRIYKIKNLL